VIGSLYIGVNIVSGDFFSKVCGICMRVMKYLTCEHAPIESQVTKNINKPDVCGHLLAHNQVDNAPGDERSSGEACLYTISVDNYVNREPKVPIPC
jgi:hypothetical protein